MMELPFDPEEVTIESYEDMTREELIECCHAHDAHHGEHHDRERKAFTAIIEAAGGISDRYVAANIKSIAQEALSHE